jgi:UDP-N-acetylglucosamine 2-epimerase (non-hydrolysing)
MTSWNSGGNGVPIRNVHAEGEVGFFKGVADLCRQKIEETAQRKNIPKKYTAKATLLKEGVSSKSIVVTGNTVIDALLRTVKKTTALPMDY